MKEKITYEWGLYDVVRDDHFQCSATPAEVAEYMMNPNVSLRLIRWHPDDGMDDCHVEPDGTFEAGGWFRLGQGTKVPKRYVEQLQRWVAAYGYTVLRPDELP